ncbi:protein SlyX [Xanthomonas sp. SS]|nr:protein SlyX [Xanthomonas sp. SS]
MIELETRLSFQEQALSEVSDALAEARAESQRNAVLLRHLLEDLGKVRSTLYADAADEPPPPHY